MGAAIERELRADNAMSTETKPSTFTTLAQAKRAGWGISCRNAGPSDWVHYDASIIHLTKGRDYLISRTADWSLQDARREALARINEIELTPEPSSET